MKVDRIFLEKIPREQKRRICALKKIQLETLQVESEFHARAHALEKEFEPIYDKLFEKRKNIVSGAHEPTDDEANVDLIHCLPKEEREALYAKSDADNGLKGLPDFWLNVLMSSNLISELIQKHDKPILKYLTDITTYVDISPPGFTLVFHFARNPFFKNTTLKKFYELQTKLEKEVPFDFIGPTIIRSSGDEIQWEDGKNITMKAVRTKQEKGPNAGRFLTKNIKAESFFDFFKPPYFAYFSGFGAFSVIGPNGEFDDLARQDFEIAVALRDHIIPRAVLFVTGEADVWAMRSISMVDDEASVSNE